MRTTDFFLVAITSIVSTALLADESNTVVDELNQHKFLSAVTTNTEETAIHHEVCNLSDSPSAFLWKKVGLGIDALNQLQSRLCAQRVQRGVEKIDRSASEVRFQDGTVDDVDTISQCLEFAGTDTCADTLLGKSASRITELSIFLSGPDQNNVQMETITIGLISLGNGLVEVFIESSDGVEHAAVVLDEEDVSVDEIRKLMGGSETLDIQTFGYFRENGNVDGGFFAEQFSSKSPTLLFRKNSDNGLRHFYKMKDINKLGELLTVLILEQGKIVALAETPVPTE